MTLEETYQYEVGTYPWVPEEHEVLFYVRYYILDPASEAKEDSKENPEGDKEEELEEEADGEDEILWYLVSHPALLEEDLALEELQHMADINNWDAVPGQDGWEFAELPVSWEVILEVVANLYGSPSRGGDA